MPEAHWNIAHPGLFVRAFTFLFLLIVRVPSGEALSPERVLGLSFAWASLWLEAPHTKLKADCTQ